MNNNQLACLLVNSLTLILLLIENFGTVLARESLLSPSPLVMVEARRGSSSPLPRFLYKKSITKKRQEPSSLCPPEYQSCSCDYIQPNIQNQPMAGKMGGGSGSSGTTNLAIMIDCQFNLNDFKASTDNSKILNEIPKLSRSGSSNQAMGKFRHLSHIAHLDLSRTAISEIPTDAFQVNLISFLYFRHSNLSAI
jgi:hypothetical protein